METENKNESLDELLEEEIEKDFEKGKEYIKKLGPGLVTGAADDDPVGIATYSQVGASFGTGLIWLSVWTLPLKIIIQEMCSRIALVTGNGLASNIKHHYPKKILYVITLLLLSANIINIGANMGVMAKTIQLTFPNIPFSISIIVIACVSSILPIIFSYKRYSKYLKWLVITLFSYIITGLIIKMDWKVLFHDSFIPQISFSKNYIFLITAIIGATLSPYLFFWQTSQEVEEEVEQGKTTVHMRRGTNKHEIKKMRNDVWGGMVLSNVVMFFIIAVSANTLFVNGITDIETVGDAVIALTPLAGPWASLLFSIGIIGTGFLAIPVLAGSTAYAISESFGWKEGLYRKIKEAKAFYITIIFSILVGIIINFMGIHYIKALIYSAIINGIISPIIIYFIVKISSNQKIMGYHKNSPFRKKLGWLVFFLVSISALATVFLIFY
jgi:NRAMP (natural resistance-associated macrophage protein)-like metal ion transporter